MKRAVSVARKQMIAAGTLEIVGHKAGIRDETRRKWSVARSRIIEQGKASQTPRGKQGDYRSSKTRETEHYQSLYELEWMKHLDQDPQVISWTKKHGILIPYGENKTYIPDFLVERFRETTLEEVKGWIDKPLAFELKNQAAKTFCAARDWEFRVLWKDDVMGSKVGVSQL